MPIAAWRGDALTVSRERTTDCLVTVSRKRTEDGDGQNRVQREFETAGTIANFIDWGRDDR